MRAASYATAAVILANAAILSAAPSYTADFATLTDAQTDFVTYRQIGQSGTRTPGSNTQYLWNNGATPSAVLASCWGQYPELVLQVGGDNNDGVFGDGVTSMEFKPYLNGGSLTDLRFGMSVRQSTKSEAWNTYPLYRVDYDGTNLVLSEHVGYESQRTLATQAVSIAAGTTYRLEFGVQGTSADSDLTLSAQLYAVGSSTALATLSGVDHPANEGAGDIADNLQDLHLSGQTGVYAGGNGGSFAGIEISSFSVAVPEPAAIGLLGFSALGLMHRRRKA